MTKYTATISWSRNQDSFSDNKYSRVHTWAFDGGAVVKASSSPHVVPVPYSSAEAIDPEEAFVASLSSCHMLWFLHLAAKGGFVVEQYEDSAEGVMARNESGKLAMTEVSLYPKVIFQVVDLDHFSSLKHSLPKLAPAAELIKFNFEVARP